MSSGNVSQGRFSRKSPNQLPVVPLLDALQQSPTTLVDVYEASDQDSCGIVT